MQDSYRSTNLDIIDIEGDNGTLNMALMFQMESTLTLRNITINEYENNFDYIMMLWNSSIKVYGCTINASSKNMYMPSIMPYFYKNDTRESIIKLNNITAGHEIYIYNKTYFHVYNDIYVESGIDVNNDSSLLVDGNIFSGAGGAYHTKVDTTGYVIVKGSFNGSDFRVHKGTIICNTLGTTRGGANDMQIINGTIITNLFSNVILPTVNRGIINTDNSSSSIYAITNSYNSISANNDNLPFLSAFPSNTNAANVKNQTFNGGTVEISNNGYLGGMNAQVNINGGTLALGENAIIGINEDDTTTIVNSITAQGNTPNEIVDINITGGTITETNGYINTPYSTLDIDSTSSNPSINVKDILAENGTVNIKSTQNHYDNPLGEGEMVGTIINNNLIAQNIEISNDARVYANNAISKTNTSSEAGYLMVGMIMKEIK